MSDLWPEPYCVTCGSPARILASRPSLDARYPVVRCRRNGHTGAGTYDAELAGRIRAAWLERSAPPPAPESRPGLLT